MSTGIHIGQMIKICIDRQKIKRLHLARRMGIPNTNIYAYEKRDTCSTDNLLRFCQALRYNFFQEVANTLPPDYEQPQNNIDQKEQRLQLQIDQLSSEIEELKKKNAVLLEIIKKGE